MEKGIEKLKRHNDNEEVREVLLKYIVKSRKTQYKITKFFYYYKRSFFLLFFILTVALVLILFIICI